MGEPNYIVDPRLISTAARLSPGGGLGTRLVD